MAEEKGFSEVVESLAAVTKKPAAAKAKEVLAVQIVDRKGMPEKKAGGAKGAEQEREKLAREKDQISLLERIAAGVTGKGKTDDGKKGGGLGLGKMLMGGLTGGGIAKFLKGALGPAALLAGLVMAIKDGIAGFFKADEWGVSKLSGTIGGIFGGVDSGLKGALWGGMKWALIGAGIGSVVPVIGTAIGGAVGALLGALLGWIGGKKIAKFIDATGIWLSEKWEVIKTFPGKIWTGIVNTVKGWLGLGPKGEVPVAVDEKDKPKKGWIDSIIDFLIPQWLIDFAKDAISTVTGWLGLTTKDDQGKVTTTAFGKLIFGTIGSLANVAWNFVKKFIPQFIIDFVASPLDTVLTWIGIKEKDKKTGEVTTTSFGKKLFGKITAIGDILGDIIGRVIGEKTWTGIKKFVANPIDYVLIDMLGWKTKEGTATAAGKEAVKTMEEGGVLPTISLIIEKIIGKPTWTAIKAFATDPVDYVLVNWLGWKKKTGELTTTGMEAMKKLDEGKIGAFWEQLLRKVIGTGTYDTIVLFIKDPIDYIFTKWLKLTSKDDKKKTTGEKAAVIAGTVVGLWEKLLAAILPKGVKDFIMSPINWAFKLFGLEKPGDTLKSVEEAHGLTIGDEKSRTGLFGKILKKIIPAGLLKFFKNPLNWILETLLGKDILAKITGGTIAQSQSIIEKSKMDPGGLFTEILKKVIPQGILDFFKSPLTWILGALLGKETAAKLMKVDVVDEAQTLLKKTTLKTKGLFDQIIEKIIPAGLMKFIKNPLDYILKEFMGIDLSKATDNAIAKSLMTGIEFPDMQKILVKAIREFIPDDWVYDKGWIGSIAYQAMPQSLITLLRSADKKRMAQGGTFSAGDAMLVGEAGPEIVKFNSGGTVLNNQRTEAMMQARIQKSLDYVRQAGAQAQSVNIQTNAPVTSTVTNTQGRLSRAPIDTSSAL